MSRKIKILFVRPWSQSYIQEDLEILQRHFDVKEIQWTRTRDLKRVLTVVKHIYKTDLSFIWFAAGHAARVVALSKIFGKKTVVVASGYSVADMPEIDYGLMISPKSARKVKFVLKNADKVLAVSEFNKKEILKYITPENVKLIYHGVDSDKFKPKSDKKNSEEDNIVITVGGISKRTIKRKGIGTFVKSANYLPHVHFAVIGGCVEDSDSVESIKYLKSTAPQNVEFTGFVSDKELIEWYQKAKVYVQISAHEAFGISLAEAMLCECVPVVTNNAALPEVVGDTGFYAPYGDSKATAEAIGEALKSDKGKEARERIKNMFPIGRRERELINIIEKIFK